MELNCCVCPVSLKPVDQTAPHPKKSKSIQRYPMRQYIVFQHKYSITQNYTAQNYKGNSEHIQAHQTKINQRIQDEASLTWSSGPPASYPSRSHAVPLPIPACVTFKGICCSDNIKLHLTTSRIFLVSRRQQTAQSPPIRALSDLI